jgi:hypothetical protein
MGQTVLTEYGQGGSGGDVWIFIHREWFIKTNKFIHCDDITQDMIGG